MLLQFGGTAADTSVSLARQQQQGEQALGSVQTPYFISVTDAQQMGTNNVGGGFNHLLQCRPALGCTSRGASGAPTVKVNKTWHENYTCISPQYISIIHRNIATCILDVCTGSCLRTTSAY